MFAVRSLAVDSASMRSSPSALALGLMAAAGLTQATMIPNAALGFSLPAKGETIARDSQARPYGKRTMIPNAELGFTLPQPESKVVERDNSERKYEKRTMIPNAKLGFTLPEPESKVVERGDPGAKYEKKTMIPNAELGFTLPAAEAKVSKRDDGVRKYEKRTMIPNAQLGFELPAAESKVVERDNSERKYERRTMIPNSELGFELPVPETKREIPGSRYEKRTMIPNAELGFTLPAAEAKVIERGDTVRKYEKRTMIPNAELGFNLPSDPKLASRSAAWQRRTMITNSELHFTLPQAGAQVEARAAPWQPAVGASWQIVLSNSLELNNGAASAVAPGVDIYDIDLFDNTAQGTDGSRIAALHAQGKRVICYFSAGTYEPNRPDSSKFTSADLGKELPDWPGEKWLKLSSANVRSIMSNRIAIASQMGCDGVDPDNVDGYVSLRHSAPMRDVG